MTGWLRQKAGRILVLKSHTHLAETCFGYMLVLQFAHYAVPPQVGSSVTGHKRASTAPASCSHSSAHRSRTQRHGTSVIHRRYMRRSPRQLLAVPRQELPGARMVRHVQQLAGGALHREQLLGLHVALELQTG